MNYTFALKVVCLFSRRARALQRLAQGYGASDRAVFQIWSGV